jgi:gag-polypeptide of LTR copia-type
LAASNSTFATSYPFSYQFPFKLTHENYLTWKYLVLSHVRGHDLIDFLDGSCPAPPVSISTVANTVSDNPAYKIWSRQDQLLLA